MGLWPSLEDLWHNTNGASLYLLHGPKNLGLWHLCPVILFQRWD
jgi:hypothetical protein